MAKRTGNSERTSVEVAKVAGQLLNGRKFAEAVAWLQQVSIAPGGQAEAREHAVVLLGGIDAARRVAASALTQR